MITVVVLAVVVLAVAYFSYCSYVAYSLMKMPHSSLEENPGDYGLTYVDIMFNSGKDGVKLSGWLILSEPGSDNSDNSDNPVVIIVSGGYQNRNDSVTGTLEISRDLVARSYDVLLFDLRGRGKSGGKARTLMHIDDDVKGAVRYLNSMSYHDISVIGFSSSAAGLTGFYGDVKSMVFDSCFASVQEMFLRHAVKRGYPLWFARAASPGTFYMISLLYGYYAEKPVELITDVSCPIFFIHGEEDSDIPPINSRILYGVRDNSQDRLWIVPGADHTQSYKTDPVGYIDRITEFFRTVELLTVR